MSPCRDVPRPRYTPSLYDVLAAGFAVGAAVGAAAGADAGVDTGADGAGALDTGAAITGALGGVTSGATTGSAVTGALTGALTVDSDAASIVATCADAFGETTGTFTPVAVLGGVVDAVSVVAADTLARSLDSTVAVVATELVTALGVVEAGTPTGTSTTDATGMDDTMDSPDSPAPVRAPAAPAPARDALRGRRSALSAAMRSAAAFVFAKPVV